MKMSQRSAKHNPKNRTTAVIWSCAVGMFALCIPLTAITGSGALLPILVILGASGGTAAVWLAPEKQRQKDVLAIRALEERIINLETIYTSLPDVEKTPYPLKGDRY